LSNGSTQPNRDYSDYHIRANICDGVHDKVLPYQVDRVIAKGRKSSETAQDANHQKGA